MSPSPGRAAKRSSARPPPLRVLVVDDHQALSESLAMAIDSQRDMACVGVASSVAQAEGLADGLRPDVVLMDVRLPDADGIEGTRRIKSISPEARVVILTAHGDLELMARAAAAGAAGFLPKTSPVKQVLEAVRTAGGGAMLVEHSTLSALVARLREPAQGERSAGPELTPREHEVLVLMSQGLDARTIAKQMVISLHTCRGHIQNVLVKLGAHSQLEAVVTAARRGLIPSPSA